MIGRINHNERACLAAFDPPCLVRRPQSERRHEAAHGPSNVIFASPHSGNLYPDAFLARSRLPLADLRRNEDAYIDALFEPAVARGGTLLQARFPRSFVDVNRFKDDYVSPNKGGGSAKGAGPATNWGQSGLGVVPTIIAENVPIYDRPPSLAHIHKRIEAIYEPYHAALSGLIEEAQRYHERVLLVDCHSMPGFAPMGARRADIVLGDRYGISCRPETMAMTEASFQHHGYSVTRNYPYAGGYVTAHYSDPSGGVEVIQIEINRDLYLNPHTYRPKSGYDRLAHNLTAIIDDILCGFDNTKQMAAQ